MVPGQVSQHFGVREDWPPLSQPTASAGARDYGCCGGHAYSLMQMRAASRAPSSGARCAQRTL